MTPLPRARLSALLWVVAFCVACSSTAPTPEPASRVRQDRLPAASPTQTASPTPTPILEIARSVLQLLEIRDREQLSGDADRVLMLLDPSADPAFRDRELALARVAAERKAALPQRELLDMAGGLGSPEGLLRVDVAEKDDQGRTRRVRYWVNTVGTTRFSEPQVERLGPPETISSESFDVRFHVIDRAQAIAAQRIGEEAVTWLVARLGPEYRPARRFTITLSPITLPGVPAIASGLVNDDGVTLLSSASMVVAEGLGAWWTRTVIAHEIAHVLLFQRGTGAWVLIEGIPLWLTDDRRQPELDRLIAANALWEFDHLVGGPRTTAEFFAAYAQASSFVRFLAAIYGARKIIELWELGRTSRFAEGFESVFGVPATTAYASWRASLPREMTRYPRVDGEPLALAPIT